MGYTSISEMALAKAGEAGQMMYPHVKRRLSWWIGDSSAYDQSENLDLDTIGLTFLLNGLAGLTFL
ncbi:unnamed protein product, partial [Heterosigma akashiwo]